MCRQEDPVSSVPPMLAVKPFGCVARRHGISEPTASPQGFNRTRGTLLPPVASSGS